MTIRLSLVLFQFSLLILRTLPSDAVAQSVGQGGVDGANGGVPSGDGERGTHGGSASDNQFDGEAMNFAVAVGGRGGHGGHGGKGDQFSPGGGDGADAGDAGHANAGGGGDKTIAGPINVTVSAVGGSGGFGGDGGTGDPPGAGGDGGDGGNAVALGRISRSAEGTTVLTVDAAGGPGGNGGGGAEVGPDGMEIDAYGPGGAGGDASAVAELSSTAGSNHSVSLTAVGGSGSSSTAPGGAGNAKTSSLIDVVGELDLEVTVDGGERGAIFGAPVTNAGSVEHRGDNTSGGDLTARYDLEGHSAQLIDAATAGGNLDVFGRIQGLTGGSYLLGSNGGSTSVQAVYESAGDAKLDYLLQAGGGGTRFDPDTMMDEVGAGGSSGMGLNLDAGGKMNVALTVAGNGGSNGGDGSIGGTFKSVGRAVVSANADGGNGLLGSAGDANVSIRVDSDTESTAQVQSRAGSGGIFDGIGNQGGTASASLIATAPGFVSAKGASVGGVGSRGKTGGNANLSIVGVSTAGGEVQATGEARGGSGGSGIGIGGIDTFGGQGGNVSLLNAVRGSTTGKLTLSQNAFGGAGGSTGNSQAGDGGSATSELSISETTSDQAAVNASAIGGQGGTANSTAGGDGGFAHSISRTQARQGQHQVNSTATGGIGGTSNISSGGGGGDAIALAQGVAIGSGLNVNVSARATGGNGNTGRDNSRFGVGGNASALADASSTGSSNYFVEAVATGGIGLVGGSAEAIAEGVVEGTGINPVLATANGGLPMFPGGFGGNAFAEATSKRINSTGDANAVAVANAGRGGRAFARAIAIGPAGEARATSNTPGLMALAVAPVGSTSIVESLTGFNIPAPVPAAAGLASYVYLTANPLKTDVLDALANNPTAHEDFDVGGASQMLTLVSMGSSYPLDGNGIIKTMSTSFTQTLDLSGVTVQQDLMVALVNPEITGSFVSLSFRVTLDGLPVVDQTFTSATALNDFFDDRSLNLGALGPHSNGKSLGVAFSFRSRTPGSGFFAQLAFGNSTPGVGPTVPEPATIALFAMTLRFVSNFRGRTRTCLPTAVVAFFDFAKRQRLAAARNTATFVAALDSYPCECAAR